MNVHLRGACVAAAIATLALGAASTALAGQDAPMLVFAANDASAQPKIKTPVASMEEHLCRTAWSTPASDSEVLAALQARAQRLGANGLTNVRYDRARTEQKSPCWQKVTVHATAVVFDTSDQMASNGGLQK